MRLCKRGDVSSDPLAQRRQRPPRAADRTSHRHCKNRRPRGAGGGSGSHRTLLSELTPRPRLARARDHCN